MHPRGSLRCAQASHGNSQRDGQCRFFVALAPTISMSQVKHIITDAITPSEYYALMNEAQMELLHVASSQNVELSKTLDLLRFSLALMRAAEADEEDE